MRCGILHEQILMLELPDSQQHSKGRLAPRQLDSALLCVDYEARGLACTFHQLPTAALDSSMLVAFRSVELPDVLSGTPPGPSVACLVSTPVCATSLRNLVRNAR
jgi:hypothetical protein